MKKQTKFYLIGGIAVAVLLVIIFGSQFGFFAVFTSQELSCNSNDGVNLICNPAGSSVLVGSNDRDLSVGDINFKVNANDVARLNLQYISNIIARDVPSTQPFFNSYKVCNSGSAGSSAYYSGVYSNEADLASKNIVDGQLFKYTGTITGCTDPYRLWRPQDLLTYTKFNNQYAILEGTASDAYGYSSKVYILMKCDLTGSAFSSCTTLEQNKYIENTSINANREIRINIEKVTIPLKVNGTSDEEFSKICPVNGVHIGDKFCENNKLIQGAVIVNNSIGNAVQDVVNQIIQNITYETTNEQIIDNTQNIIDNSDLTNSEQQQVIDTISEKYDIVIPESKPNYVLWVLIGLITVIVLMVIILLIRRR